jgi:hypothetical protein
MRLTGFAGVPGLSVPLIYVTYGLWIRQRPFNPTYALGDNLTCQGTSRQEQLLFGLTGFARWA